MTYLRHDLLPILEASTDVPEHASSACLLRILSSYLLLSRVQVDVFLHTYDLTHLTNTRVGEDAELNTTEWKLLAPYDVSITSQAAFLEEYRRVFVAANPACLWQRAIPGGSCSCSCSQLSGVLADVYLRSQHGCGTERSRAAPELDSNFLGSLLMCVWQQAWSWQLYCGLGQFVGVT